jgi:glutathione S-transferase
MVERSGPTGPPGSTDTGDEIIAALLRAHGDLTPGESAMLDRRLVLTLATRLDDVELVRAAIETARTGLGGGGARMERHGAVLHGGAANRATQSVAIALALKGIAAEHPAAATEPGAGRNVGPRGSEAGAFGPLLDIDGLTLTHPLAAIAYLDETRPRPPLMPVDPARRARMVALAQLLAAEGAETSAGVSAQSWLARRLAAAEALLDEGGTGPFAHGALPGLADCCLAPLLLSARRLGVDLAPMPRLRAIEKACAAMPAFSRARPVSHGTSKETTA